MALWDKVRQELSEAGRAAQDALDEGRLRLDILRARQRADRAAQALGYAVHRARETGAELGTEEYAHLSREVATNQSEVTRAEEQLDVILGRRRTRYGTGSAASDAGGSTASESSGGTASGSAT